MSHGKDRPDTSNGYGTGRYLYQATVRDRKTLKRIKKKRKRKLHYDDNIFQGKEYLQV
jgi:hypothetical protein